MTDTSGMLPNWLSEAVADQHDPREIAQAILRATEWIDVLGEAVKEAEEIMHAQRSKIGPAGGYPSYNHEVARAIVTRLVSLYPEVGLTKP
jgi:hypothetical protein